MYEFTVSKYLLSRINSWTKDLGGMVSCGAFFHIWYLPWFVFGASSVCFNCCFYYIEWADSKIDRRWTDRKCWLRLTDLQGCFVLIPASIKIAQTPQWPPINVDGDARMTDCIELLLSLCAPFRYFDYLLLTTHGARYSHIMWDRGGMCQEWLEVLLILTACRLGGKGWFWTRTRKLGRTNKPSYILFLLEGWASLASVIPAEVLYHIPMLCTD